MSRPERTQNEDYFFPPRETLTAESEVSLPMTDQGKRPEEDRKNDRRRRTTRSETNSINERRHVDDPNQGPKHERT